MTQDTPEISIIVPTYNRSGFLIDTLDSLVAGSCSTERYELIIVDNNSTDDTQKVAKKFIKKHPRHQISHVIEKNQGASFSRNRGIKEASAPLLLFVDDDELADTNFISNWLTFFEEHPKAIGGGGQIEVKFEDPRPKWMSHFLMPLLGEHKLADAVKKYGASDFPFAGNMAYRKEVFQQYGLLKTDLGRKGKGLLAGEEKEFYKRIRNYTDQIYFVPDAKVFHRVHTPRMTQAFIKKQALGLGKTLHLMLESAGPGEQISRLGTEIFKTCASLVLFVIYMLGFNYPKASMLLKFRWWIWKGYFTF